MMRLSWWAVLGLIGGCLAFNTHAEQSIFRDFWYPLYHAERLDYCLTGQTNCGAVVAKRYCRLMGYQRAKNFQIEHHVGLTHYLGVRSQCQGWRCDGFKLITCEGGLTRTQPASYLRRKRTFALPRFDHYRVAWCYNEGHACGKRAAYGFCRRMGYNQAVAYTQQSKVPATEALGDKTLCFGQHCKGFASITCHR